MVLLVLVRIGFYSKYNRIFCKKQSPPAGVYTRKVVFIKKIRKGRAFIN
jgi:hypothetical protein